MAKPYSQDLRDRVIDAVKRGEMSRRAAARRYEISNSVAINGFNELNGMARESLSDRRPSRLQADAAPGFSRSRAGREMDVKLRPCAIAFRPSEGSKPTPR